MWTSLTICKYIRFSVTYGNQTKSRITEKIWSADKIWKNQKLHSRAYTRAIDNRPRARELSGAREVVVNFYHIRLIPKGAYTEKNPPTAQLALKEWGYNWVIHSSVLCSMSLTEWIDPPVWQTKPPAAYHLSNNGQGLAEVSVFGQLIWPKRTVW